MKLEYAGAAAVFVAAGAVGAVGVYLTWGLVAGVLHPSAFNEALQAAKSMPGWTIVASDPEAGRIEASQQSRWFRFTDDIVIRIAGDGAGTRIDMRSTSRQGHSDYGINAARIRAFMGALRRRIG